MDKYYGKYRGTVLNNIDPEQRGRRMLQIPYVLRGISSVWAEPCFALAGPGGPLTGIYVMPPVGADVWVEFEGGNAEYPICVGCHRRWDTEEQFSPVDHPDPLTLLEITIMSAGQSSIVVSGLPRPTGGLMLKSTTGESIIVNKIGTHIQKQQRCQHYFGLIELLENVNFTFGTVYHNGIDKFQDSDDRLPEYDTTLGETPKENRKKFLKTCFNTLDDLLVLQQEGFLQLKFTKMVFALTNARDQGRLQNVQRLRRGDLIPDIQVEGKPFQIQVLGPVCTDLDDFQDFNSSDSHTVNGHSLVLKIRFGTCTLLFGGDLNTYSEKYLLDAYQDQPGLLEVDVAKSCHHGASEFSVPFMAAVNPYATVISSGDNETYSHPRADAIGCAGRYSKGERPLVFSTELARSVSKEKIIFGMIDLRCNGQSIYMAQMKEANIPADIWDSYQVK